MAQLVTVGTVVLQGGIVLLLLESLRRRDFAAAVNAALSLAASLVPAALELVAPLLSGQSVTVGPELSLWIAAAGLIHSFGMLGPYDTVEWWDSVTHTVSAALVAALAYAGLIVVAPRVAVLDPSFGGLAVLTVVLTLAAGVFWELIELIARDVGRRYDVEPVLVHYGRRDTALDLVFDVVGALLVVGFDLRVFVPVAAQSVRATTWVLVASGVVIVLGSLVMGVHVERSSVPRE
jgi:hypothetical protein